MACTHEDALDLIKQVLVKHSAAVLEEMHDQIVTRNTRISNLEFERGQLRECLRQISTQTDQLIVHELAKRALNGDLV